MGEDKEERENEVRKLQEDEKLFSQSEVQDKSLFERIVEHGSIIS